MTLEVIITRDYEHMSDVSATILIPQITVATRQQKPKTVHVGLPTGSSPVGLKDHIVNRQEEFLGGMVEWSNPDEYVDLPGNTPFERASHPSSYRTEMDNFYRRLNQQPL